MNLHLYSEFLAKLEKWVCKIHNDPQISSYTIALTGQEMIDILKKDYTLYDLHSKIQILFYCDILERIFLAPTLFYIDPHIQFEDDRAKEYPTPKDLRLPFSLQKEWKTLLASHPSIPYAQMIDLHRQTWKEHRTLGAQSANQINQNWQNIQFLKDSEGISMAYFDFVQSQQLLYQPDSEAKALVLQILKYRIPTIAWNDVQKVQFFNEKLK